MPTPIQHLVVLMLENRSFDHMLGFMKATNPSIDGLNGDEWNYPARELDPNVVVTPNAGDVHDLNPDPHHDFDDVTAQIFSNGITVPADMRGFVRDYFTLANDPVRAGNVMKCFTPATLPVLTTLATQYAVCDHWFSSVPGSTIPNRMFVHGANSAGSVNQDAVSAPFLLHTIFESFDATTPYDFRIYANGASILLANKYLIENQGKFFSYSQFAADARNGNLPAYTFIEPTYDDDNQGNFANSQHPDFPIDRGEALISDVYYALTRSPGWKNTLFLILYDEHGGTFDHVVPPTVNRLPSSAGVPNVTLSVDPAFDFTRLGVRVPAVFVSPCIPPNTLFNTRNYEHSSVVATVRKLFCPGSKPLTWREAQAPTFDDVLSLTGSAIRTDVVKLPNPVISNGIQIQASAEQRTATDLSVLMACAMQHSLGQANLKPPPGDPRTLNNAAAVSLYLRQCQQAVAAGAPK